MCDTLPGKNFSLLFEHPPLTPSGVWCWSEEKWNQASWLLTQNLIPIEGLLFAGDLIRIFIFYPDFDVIEWFPSSARRCFSSPRYTMVDFNEFPKAGTRLSFSTSRPTNEQVWPSSPGNMEKRKQKGENNTRGASPWLYLRSLSPINIYVRSLRLTRRELA